MASTSSVARPLVALTVAVLGCAALLVFARSRTPSHPVAEPMWSGIELVLVTAGTFRMGSPEGLPGRESQERQHWVRLTKSFYIGRSEITQAQWQSVMGINPSHFAKCGLNCPVEGVSYDDVQAFLNRLNQTGRGFRLPTEAEWEFACRAGGDGAFGHGRALGATDANIDGRFPYGASPGRESQGTMPVRSFPPNAWGLFDMSGNVWEWVQDWHCPYPDGHINDPLGRCESEHRVIRGGSWRFDGNSARCGLRYTHRPTDRGFSLGFRVARDLD